MPRTYKLPKRVENHALWVANGRISVRQAVGPADEHFPPRYFLMIDGILVAPMSMPNQGYRSYREAQRDGTEYKKAARKLLRANSG